MLGVIKLLPVPKLVPPVAAAYQLTTPVLLLDVAPKVTVPAPVPQRLPLVTVGFAGLP